MPEIPERFRAPVVHELPDMGAVAVQRDLIYRHVDEGRLLKQTRHLGPA